MVPPVLRETVSTYDHIATTYARRATHPLEREIERFCGLLPAGGVVLDVGCGAGQYARALRFRGMRVLPLDLSIGMLREARKLMTPNLIQADMRWLPFPTGVADGCFVCASLLHLPRACSSSALRECRRVLHVGGALYLSVKEGAGAAWVANRFFTYYRSDEVDALLRAAGFEIVDGWFGPPADGDGRHRWINRFAVASSFAFGDSSYRGERRWTQIESDGNIL